MSNPRVRSTACVFRGGRPVRDHYWILVDKYKGSTLMVKAYATRREARRTKQNLYYLFGRRDWIRIIQVVPKYMAEPRCFGRLRCSRTWWVVEFESSPGHYFIYNQRSQIGVQTAHFCSEEVRVA